VCLRKGRTTDGGGICANADFDLAKHEKFAANDWLLYVSVNADNLATFQPSNNNVIYTLACVKDPELNEVDSWRLWASPDSLPTLRHEYVVMALLLKWLPDSQ
jgi:hypothetical protein